MFSEEQLQVIFSNIEDLLVFQEKFLEDLEANVDWEHPHRSCLAPIFLNHVRWRFVIYCISHDSSL